MGRAQQDSPDMAMNQYLLIPFLGGWTSINPSYFDVHQGYKVLTHCHIIVNLQAYILVIFHISGRQYPEHVRTPGLWVTVGNMNEGLWPNYLFTSIDVLMYHVYSKYQ